MKLGLTLIITITGFVLGMLFAGGVEKLSAKTIYRIDQIYSSFSGFENPKSIEDYWSETGISFKEVNQLITNKKCHSSEIYFKSCLNSLILSALSYEMKLTQSGNLIELDSWDRLDEKTEKELLEVYLKKHLGLQKINFEELMFELYENENVNKRAQLAAKMINTFYSVYYDPHTYILPANYYGEVGSKIARSKYFVGISYEKTNGQFFIKKVYKNSDADMAGLKDGDKIIELNSFVMEEARYSEVSALLRDEKQKVLKFKIERNNEYIEVNVKRSFSSLKHVQYSAVKDDKNFGYLSVTKFNFGACAEVSALLEKAKKNQIEGLILDLRDNPGGQLNEASCLTGLFLGTDKKAYYVEYFDQSKSNEVVLTADKMIYDGPLVVLINSGSASASELLAGALQEYGRAQIIGERSFGKGTFQEPEPWLLNSKISIYKTQGFYLLPSRNSTQIVGVKPDIDVRKKKLTDKREAQMFYNPISVSKNRYDKLVNTKKNNRACESRLQDETEDQFLQKSIDYLECMKKQNSIVAITLND